MNPTPHAPVAAEVKASDGSHEIAEEICSELHTRFCSDIPNDGTYTLGLNETETMRFFKVMEDLIARSLDSANLSGKSDGGKAASAAMQALNETFQLECKRREALEVQNERQADIIRDTATPANERELRMLEELRTLRARLEAAEGENARLVAALLFCDSFADQCETAEDRSNLDGDSAEAVLLQINEAAFEARAKIAQALAPAPAGGKPVE